MSGQATLESLLTLPLIAAACVGLLASFTSEWRRWRCGIETFETALAIRNRDGRGLTLAWAERTPRSWRVRRACGQTVELPLLEPLREETGQTTVLLALLIAGSALAALTFWGLARSWRFEVQTQLRLDRCVATRGRELRGHLSALQTGETALRGLRVALAASLVAQPQAAPALRAAIQATDLARRGRILAWQARQAEWLLRRGCDGEPDLALPLPGIPLRLGPPDTLGPRPGIWTAEALGLRLIHGRRRSAARVERVHRDWRARYVPFVA